MSRSLSITYRNILNFVQSALPRYGLSYFPTTNTSNCPASAVDRKNRWVLGSSAIVFALGNVFTFSATEYLSAPSCRTTVIEPSIGIENKAGSRVESSGIHVIADGKS